MKKKRLIIAVISVVLLLSVLFVGCTPKIDTSKENVNENVIQVLQNAITESIKQETYYVVKQDKSDDKNMIQYKLNVVKDDKTIDGKSNKKVKFDVIYTKGIESYTDTFIFGQSLSSTVKSKEAKADDYKSYAFSNYKKAQNAPKHSKASAEIDLDEMKDFETGTKLKINDFTMESLLAPLKSLTDADLIFDKDTESGNFKKGKVTNFAFKVNKAGHEYNDKGVIKVQVFEGKIMRIMTADEKYIVDTMYQGPKFSIPNYDTFAESHIPVSLVSDRTDGMVLLYETEDYNATTIQINPKDTDIKVELVDSVVDYNNTFTEVVYTDANGVSKHYFVLTKNIENDSFDIASLIPIVGVAVGAIALIVALLALWKLRKANKQLTKKIAELTGEDRVEEDDIIADTDTGATDANQAEEVMVEESIVDESQEDVQKD